MNKYSYNNSPRGMSWWWLVGLLAVVWMAVVAGMGPQAPSIPATSTGTCAEGIAPEDTHLWIDRLGGWANYDGTTGYWYDLNGSVVGYSSAEDSDICSFVTTSF